MKLIPVSVLQMTLNPSVTHQKYKGRRVKRGLFKTANGQVINADINGSLNIIRMYSPEAFNVEGIASCGVQPLKVNPLERVGED